MNGHVGATPAFPGILSYCARGAKRKILWAILLFLISFAFWPVETLVIRSPEATSPIFRAASPLGLDFWTIYIHSVERTPVLDRYRIANNRVWPWQTRIRSQNAGLPTHAPRFGRAYMTPCWLVIEGGRQAWPEIFLRVGNADLGRNAFHYGSSRNVPWVSLYDRHPGQRLHFGIERLPLLAAWADKNFTAQPK